MGFILQIAVFSLNTGKTDQKNLPTWTLSMQGQWLKRGRRLFRSRENES